MSLRHQPWMEALLALRNRNEAVDVTDLGDAQSVEMPTTYRARVLEVTERAIVIEQPARAVHDGRLNVGDTLYVLIAHDGQRWEFQVDITQGGTFPLNEQQRVPALMLPLPDAVHNAQRREFFRVAIGDDPLPPIELRAIGGDDDPFEATIINIGGGGIGITTPLAMEACFEDQEHFACTFSLPSHDEPIHLRCRLVHLQQSDRRHLYAGFIFDFADGGERETIQDLICRFTAWYQRRELHRQRDRLGRAG